MTKKIEMNIKQHELENKSPEELLNIFGAMTFTIATIIRQKTDSCPGCIGMNMLDVFMDANKQADQVYERNRSKVGKMEMKPEENN